MTITVRVQTSQKEEVNDLVGTFNTLETHQLAHLIDVLKTQSVKGNIITGDLFFNVSEIILSASFRDKSEFLKKSLIANNTYVVWDNFQ